MDPNAAVSGLRSYAQQNYNYNISDQEFGDYAKKTGYTGGPVTDDQYQAAKTEIDNKLVARKKVPQTIPPPGPVPTPLPANYQFQPQTNQLMGSILQNPQTMNQRWQDQRFEQGKESAVDMRKQLGEQAAQRTAGRGWSQQGGVNQAILGGLDERLMSDLLAGRRQVAQDAAVQNRQDELQALGAANAMDQQGFTNNLATNNQALQHWLAQQSGYLENAQLGENQRQFNQNYGLDFLRFLTNQDQFNKTFGEGQRQFNNTMGLNWFNAGNNQQNSLMEFLYRYGF